jgi:uncharacterized protein with NRDE domain
MCLLIMVAQTNVDFPLIVAANRDEMFDRPAVAMTVLRDAGPRILGGRDELAGGTWLAVNEAGVVAGLTNRPMTGGRDPTKRSRGELPVALAGHTSAAAAVDAFGSRFRTHDYNPAWLLVGDREALFAVDTSGHAPVIRALPPGVHILENRPVGAKSPKAQHVTDLVAGIESLPEGELVQRLKAVLADHEVPPGPSAVDDTGTEAPAEIKAACVHTKRYGTRWSCVITVPGGSAHPPTVRYADGAACTADYQDASSCWRRGHTQEQSHEDSRPAQ